ncbi:hypothetical protein N7471_002418 [Penicillium samsonianum]|uniref:uncharacterized protein n=1 Tax=Penicillium samsonianum TaxID=1882272 RepID=UPI002547239E|nr:uncharacterized protein N7471_002418 [Penicillium samsonianum]KAJ6142965.1 hypothetical protein N7471_002418 [Penicillium samsonianum]
MTIPARDSMYGRERKDYLDLLQSQVMKLRADPSLRLHVVERLRDLHRMTPGCLEGSQVVSDTLFHQICCTLQPLYRIAIATLIGDSDPASVYRVADMLEGAVPWEVRDPFNTPAT